MQLAVDEIALILMVLERNSVNRIYFGSRLLQNLIFRPLNIKLKEMDFPVYIGG